MNDNWRRRGYLHRLAWKGTENMTGFWEGLTVITKLLELVKALLGLKKKRDETALPVHTENPALQAAASANGPTRERYQVLLGRRHRFLREEILKLNPREMADFYRFEKVQELEDYEDGKDEFPSAAIKKLTEFFFVDPKYLQEGGEIVFQTFPLAYTQDSCQRFLDDGFEPQFLCGPNFDEDGHAVLAFTKRENNLQRMIRSHSVGSFRSTGGGKANVHNLIHPMLERGMSWSAADFVGVNETRWEQIWSGRWYTRRSLSYPGSFHYKASDIFQQWYETAARERQQYLDQGTSQPATQLALAAAKPTLGDPMDHTPEPAMVRSVTSRGTDR